MNKLWRIKSSDRLRSVCWSTIPMLDSLPNCPVLWAVNMHHVGINMYLTWGAQDPGFGNHVSKLSLFPTFVALLNHAWERGATDLSSL